MNYFKENIWRHVTSWHFPIFIGAMALGHYFGRKLLVRYNEKHGIKHSVENTRYFMMHFLFNMCSTVYTYKYMIETLNNPLIIRRESNVLSFYNVLFHAYHTAFYWKSIDLDEKCHHGVIVFLMCPLTWLHYTNLCNTGHFFVMGLPGGLIYLLLSLKDLKLIEPVTEKRISKHLNMWVRAPGTVITSYIIYLNYVAGNFGKMSFGTKFAVFLSMFGMFWNGMYFASTIIESYAVHKYKIQKQIEHDNQAQ